MRIGIDARVCRGWQTGVGRIVIELARRLAVTHDVVVVYGRDTQQVPEGVGPTRVVFVFMPCRIASMCQFVSYAFGRLPDVDIWLFTHPLATPWWTRKPAIGMVLDVYPLLFPSDFPRSVSMYYRLVVPLVERSKRLVVAISEASKKDAVKWLRLSSDRVRTVYLGVSDAFRPIDPTGDDSSILNTFGLVRPYVAYCGNLRPHKNVPRLIAAYAQCFEVMRDCPDLVIVGSDDQRRSDGGAAIMRQVAELGIASHVCIMGVVSDWELAALYRRATAVVVPSLYEGFGLTALEAMACGTPVIAGNRGALPEVVGKAGMLVDPFDTQAMAGAMLEVIGSTAKQRQMIEAGLDRARQFSWDRAAAELDQLIVEVAGTGMGDSTAMNGLARH